MTTIRMADIEAAHQDARETRTASPVSFAEAGSRYQCMECGRRFKSHRSAERAVNDGCPRCGGTDIDLASRGWKCPMGLTITVCNSRATTLSLAASYSRRRARRALRVRPAV